jgi:hypothetical protein
MTEEQSHDNKKLMLGIINLVTSLVATMGVVLGGWLLTELGTLSVAIQEIDKRLVAVEATRFTSEQAIDVERRLNRLERDQAVINERLPRIRE